MAALQKVPLIIYQALDLGASKVAAYRDMEFNGELLDEGMAASILRCHARRYLVKHGVHAVDDDFVLDLMPFLGISLYYNGLHIRVLKGPAGTLPGCGTSEKRTRFYNQVQSRYLVGRDSFQTEANLLILWDFSPNYSLSAVWLALPAKGGQKPGDVSSYWIGVIPHPSEGVLPGIPQPQAPIVTNEGLDDLITPVEDEDQEDQANER